MKNVLHCVLHNLLIIMLFFTYGSKMLAQETINFNICGPNDGGEITFLKADRESPTENLKVAKWQSAFSGNSNNPNLDSEFYDSDIDRFYVKIEDETKIGNGTIQAHLKTYDKQNDFVDDILAFDLIEEPINSGIFISGSCILVSNKVDDEIITNNNTINYDETRLRTVNIFNDEKIIGADNITPTPLEIKVGGTVVIEYDSNTGMGPLPNTENFSSNGINICNNEIHKISIRGFVLKRADGTAFIDELGFQQSVATMNASWAQCCIEIDPIDFAIVDFPDAEIFSDMGFDHDGNVDTDPIGGGNNKFDFNDFGIDNDPTTEDFGQGDGIHNPGEWSEPYENRPNLSGMINNSYDFGIDISDGLGSMGDNTMNSEVKALLDFYGDDNEETIEIYAINRFNPNNARGRAFPANFENFDMKLLTDNQLIIPNFSLGYFTGPFGGDAKDYIVASHELGHIILQPNLNIGHRDEDTIVDKINVMVTEPQQADKVNHSKRLDVDQETAAKSF